MLKFHKRRAATCVAAAVALATSAGCRGGEGEAPASLWREGQARRTIIPSSWGTVWIRGGGADTVVLNPYLLTSDGERVFVYDGGRRQVVALAATDGAVLWRVGSEGSGPDEFRGVRDLKADMGGGVYALDPRNNRVVHLTADGRVSERIPLDGVGHAEQLAPLAGDRFVLLTMAPDSAFAVLDRTGHVQRRFSLPWSGFASLDQLSRQGYLAARNGAWTFGFSVGNGWFTYRDTVAGGYAGQYVEHTEFPRVVTSAAGETSTKQLADFNACSGCSIAMSDSVLYVHFGGYSGERRRTLDRYRLRNGDYLGSVRLPREATVVEVVGDLVLMLYEDPYPRIAALRFKPAR